MRFHAIHTQFDGFVDIVTFVGENFRDPLFYVDFVWNGRNIRGAADGDRYAAYSSSVQVKALVDELCNTTEQIVVRLACDYVAVENKLPSVFEIEYFLHVRCCHAVDDAVVDDFGGLWKGSGDAFQYRLIVNIRFHVRAGEIDILYDAERQFVG